MLFWFFRKKCSAFDLYLRDVKEMDFVTIKQKEVQKRGTSWSEMAPPNCIRSDTPTTLLTDLGAYWRLKGRKTDCQHALLTSEPLFIQKSAFKLGEGRVKLLHNFKVFFFSSLNLLCKICLAIQIGLFPFFIQVIRIIRL